ncbi:MAG: peptidase S1 [Oscillatoriales cyanobacterium]|uniref:COP23 domain-containing protein n=1 Tax=Microcoleus sp. PH2017_05_CCC_O_A TaxID=2798816 RepID=UPI001D1FB374|nr:COP23 domain-containing protein [Microcoleus sp. PH2017_05_CCC_O_A]MCC3464594.1 trypsin-like peptidase domain-containing protein [Microcoleus sp. PH2017_06_SFM_O_A]TAG01245.1 MAG: peptidase S1 [Oscillatoriales cyanobacterium]MCC3438913.1 trypsin-like peptidase domain-containing protein [Microcoleus sp. PH2017_05_CCC_O_A]TAG21617.1 MAG: peptidase S1 [Oscillatoriales cyanobacterium]TAG34647.1 MAG: peptidase S1 [Oscillatoriales cyanobacterium]
MNSWGLRFDALTVILTGAVTAAAIVGPQYAACAKTAQEVAELAMFTTVEVNNTLGFAAGGSGVIIAKQGNIYTVLTANHVVASLAQEYSIRTHSEKSYTAIRIQRLPKNDRDIDLALIQFQSRDRYPVAPIGESQRAVVGSTIYVAGYPLPVASGSERKLEFTAGIISSRVGRASSGYGLRYQAVTRRGMSGGPVFDADGRVVGIHGQGDTVGTVQSQWNGQTEEIKTGLNAAIPIDAFTALRSQTKPNGFDILSNIAINRSSPQTQPNLQRGGFVCDTSTGEPVTVYQNPQGFREPWIRWNSNFFSSAGYDPLTRCQQVTQRLDNYNRNKQLNYVTVGLVNNQKAICTSSRINGPCEGLIYTLRRDQDPAPALSTFFVWLANQKARPSLFESGAPIYINLGERLDVDIAEP